jgi:excisionase family DNA binding protein
MTAERTQKMKRLTLDEAAEELRIKRESVYKRVRRGTLPYTKASDGRMYVYLDGKNDVEKDEAHRQSGDAAQNQSRTWLEYLAAGAGVVALLGGLTYG